MEVRPILSAMRRNKFGALLISMQIGLTLAILANSLTLIEQRSGWSSRPTGTDEDNIFIVSAESIEQPNDLVALQATDISALRSVGGVIDAYATNSYPLQGGGWSMSVDLARRQRTSTALTAYYFGDEHALHVLGLKLIAGRNFTAQEIQNRSATVVPEVGGLIVTRALALQLFPGGDALGKSIFVESPDHSSRIIGIVDQLEGPFLGATGHFSTFTDNSTLAPYRPLDGDTIYMARAQPGQLEFAIKSARDRLQQINGSRIIRIKSMREVRSQASRNDRGLTVLLTAICITLTSVTGFGIVGLTSYWVSQRRRQIGIRRAVGANRAAIVRYFLTENLLIAMAGIVGGIALAIALNLWMVSNFEMVRIQIGQLIAAALVMLLIGQLGVLWPALRAASIPAALAARGA
jgi:putative ABC transport system permease protein